MNGRVGGFIAGIGERIIFALEWRDGITLPVCVVLFCCFVVLFLFFNLPL